MKIKTMNKEIKKAIDGWIHSLPEIPGVSKFEIQDSVMVTGGCIASMFLGTEVNDFDVYFTDYDVAKKVFQMYADQTKGKLVCSEADLKMHVSPDANLNDIIDFSTILDKKTTDDDDDEMREVFNKVDKDKPLFFYTQEDAKEKRIKFFYQSVGVYKKKTKKAYAPVFISSNAVTLNNQIQLINRFIGPVEEIHKNFDFVHCTNYWTYRNGVVTNKKALEALLSRELIYVGSRYPLASVIRTRKFIKRGFNICAGEYVKMALQINTFDLKNVYTLSDQLMGVDLVYFDMFLRSLVKYYESNKEIEMTMVYRMLDEVFHDDEIAEE